MAIDSLQALHFPAYLAMNNPAGWGAVGLLRIVLTIAKPEDLPTTPTIGFTSHGAFFPCRYFEFFLFLFLDAIIILLRPR